MPKLVTQTPLGYRIELDNGVTYDMPEDVAHASFPDLFPSAGQAYVPEQVGQAQHAGAAPMGSPAQQEQWSPFSELQAPPSAPAQAPPWQTSPQQAQPPQGAPGQTYGVPDLLPTPGQAAGMQVSPGQSVSIPVSRTGGGFQKYDLRGIPNPADQAAQLAPGYMQVGQALNQQQVAAQKAAQVGYDPALGPTYDQVTEQENARAQEAQTFDHGTDAILQDHRQRIEQARAMIGRTDPGRWFNDKTLPQQITATFTAAIAGFLNPGGTNQVIEQAMQLIDQDLEAQKFDIETQKFNVLGLETAYDRMVGERARSRSAMLEARQFKIQALMNAITRQQQKYQSEVVLMEYEKAKGQLMLEYVKTGQALDQQYRQNLETAMAHNFKVDSLQAQLRAAAADRAARAQKEAKPPKPAAEIFRMSAPSDPRRAVSLQAPENSAYANWPETTQNKWQDDMRRGEERNRAVNDYIEFMQKGKALYKGLGKDWLNYAKGDAEFAAEYNRLQATMIETFGRQEAGANYTAQEMDLRKAIQGEVDGILIPGHGLEAALKVRDELVQRRADMISRAGVEIVEQSPVALPFVNPDGTPFREEQINAVVQSGQVYGSVPEFRQKAQPGNSRALVEGSFAPPPSASAVEEASMVGWDTGLAALERTASDILSTPDPAARELKREQLSAIVAGFPEYIERADEQGNQIAIDRAKKILKSLPAEERIVDRGLIQTMMPQVWQQYSMGRKDLPFRVDALEVLEDYEKTVVVDIENRRVGAERRKAAEEYRAQPVRRGGGLD